MQGKLYNKFIIQLLTIIITVFLYLNNTAITQDQPYVAKKQMNLLEELSHFETLIGLENPTAPIIERLNIIETKIFGNPLQGSIDQRINSIRTKLDLNIQDTKTETFDETKSYICKDKFIRVKRGYRLQFGLPEKEIKPHQIGDTFDLILTQDFKIDGHLIFKKGSIVQARVIKVKTSGKVYESGIIDFDYLPYKLDDGSEIHLIRRPPETKSEKLNKRVTGYAVFGPASLLMWPANEELSTQTRIWGFVKRSFEFCIDQ